MGGECATFCRVLSLYGDADLPHATESVSREERQGRGRLERQEGENKRLTLWPIVNSKPRGPYTSLGASKRGLYGLFAQPTDDLPVRALSVISKFWPQANHFNLFRLVTLNLVVPFSPRLECASPLSPRLRRSPVARRPETLKAERSGTVVAQCGGLEADSENLDGKSDEVWTEGWKTKGLATP
jgi:hypothetical protein